jgi:hypothetical protein
VRYRTGPDGSAWVGNPGVVTCAGACGSPTQAELNTIVREVEVTVWARAAAANLSGQTTAAGAAAAVRGQLTTTISPRAATQARNLRPAGATDPDWF